MTVAANDTIERYVISGAGPYPFSWRIFNNSDLQVYALSLAVPPVPTLLALNTHYTVTGANDQNGGSITLLTAAFTPYAGFTLDIRSNTPEDQPTSIRNQARFLPEIHEDAYDYLSRQIQDLRRLVNAKIGAPDYEPTLDMTIPPVATRAGKYSAYDVFGKPVASSGTGNDSALRADLASTVVNADGSRLVGFRRTEAGSVARSVALALASLPGINLADFVTDFNAGSDQTLGINAAIAAAMLSINNSNSVYHPGGSVRHDSTITLPNGITFYGPNRRACKFTYPGLGDGFKNVNPINSSGNAQVNIFGLQFDCSNVNNVGAALEVNAGGWSYYQIHDNWFTGRWKYGTILDATEITAYYSNHIALNTTTTAPIGLWMVNGPDRQAGQFLGYTNVNQVFNNQINGSGTAGGVGIADDGGNAHIITGNNVDGFAQGARFAAMINLIVAGNSFENAQTTITASDGVLFTNLGLGGVARGVCSSGTYGPNTHSINLAAGGTSLKFGGTGFHTGIHVCGNYFVNVQNRSVTINIANLGNGSRVTGSFDEAFSGFHYSGVHIDANGPEYLGLPQSGFGGTIGISGPTYADTRFPQIFGAGALFGSEIGNLSGVMSGSKVFDWPNIAAGASTNTTVTVNGLRAGDLCLASMSIDLTTQGRMSAHWESNDTARVILSNVDAVSALNLPSGTLKVVALRVA